jgi:hypothetical protein
MFSLIQKKTDSMALKIINIFAFSLMILMNYLANALPLGDNTTGELSARYPNLFVPAGLTFSICAVQACQPRSGQRNRLVVCGEFTFKCNVDSCLALSEARYLGADNDNPSFKPYTDQPESYPF